MLNLSNQPIPSCLQSSADQNSLHIHNSNPNSNSVSRSNSLSPLSNPRRSASLKLAAVLNRRSSKRVSVQNLNQDSTTRSSNNSSSISVIHTLPIIQPQSYWSPQPNSRHFRINLHNPRQQVTSLLALSSIPRPVSPPPHEDSEPSAMALIATATRAAMEEEATTAAILASLHTHALESERTLPPPQFIPQVVDMDSSSQSPLMVQSHFRSIPEPHHHHSHPLIQPDSHRFSDQSSDSSSSSELGRPFRPMVGGWPCSRTSTGSMEMQRVEEQLSS
ncbi:hypothetical protein CROQUDRAFT_360886 [Cronartium quercuum f. sp. fusiforme G11]|uniref:Uncharacterized protein n=1 Tax=Cronartium quercuum f. sp. fusiforme G11 TaxID=708437 RepID=A0A9P6NRJ2_9BASI|nr:hypothetical protein CROQUDRAFT_360886 [Cronartium quercuum f. sp. fusiforme G11]